MSAKMQRGGVMKWFSRSAPPRTAQPIGTDEPSGVRVGCATVVLPFLAIPAGAALLFGFTQANIGLVLFGLFQLLIIGFAVMGVVTAGRELVRRSRATTPKTAHALPVPSHTQSQAGAELGTTDGVPGTPLAADAGDGECHE